MLGLFVLFFILLGCPSPTQTRKRSGPHKVSTRVPYDMVCVVCGKYPDVAATSRCDCDQCVGVPGNKTVFCVQCIRQKLGCYSVFQGGNWHKSFSRRTCPFSDEDKEHARSAPSLYTKLEYDHPFHIRLRERSLYAECRKGCGIMFKRGDDRHLLSRCNGNPKNNPGYDVCKRCHMVQNDSCGERHYLCCTKRFICDFCSAIIKFVDYNEHVRNHHTCHDCGYRGKNLDKCPCLETCILCKKSFKVYEDGCRDDGQYLEHITKCRGRCYSCRLVVKACDIPLHNAICSPDKPLPTKYCDYCLVRITTDGQDAHLRHCSTFLPMLQYMGFKKY